MHIFNCLIVIQLQKVSGSIIQIMKCPPATTSSVENIDILWSRTRASSFALIFLVFDSTEIPLVQFLILSNKFGNIQKLWWNLEKSSAPFSPLLNTHPLPPALLGILNSSDHGARASSLGSIFLVFVPMEVPFFPLPFSPICYAV